MANLLLEWLSINGLVLFGIGVLAAIIGVMFGAAGFVLLPSLLLVGIPIHATVAVNKFATGVSSFTTVLVLVLKKKVQLKRMLPLMFFASLGGISGAFLATRLSELTMNAVACIVLIAMFIVVLKSNKTGLVSEQQDQEQPVKEQRSTLLAPFFIGIYDGGFGPGSALLNITYFLKKQFSYVNAAEMTRFMMFGSCMSAFLFYFFYGIVDWGIAIPVTAGSIIGSHIGLKIVPYLKGKWLQVLLPIIFLLLIVQVVLDLLFSS
ncbi:sulfite exporter TauE/SafE family protein [Ureibacillus aquaedulcis]|uniref:Probable membrane transporter protein n=1 Tax=Ureibacillus aquaedulcis TaxID=3058421 RepID=A0ABT8GSR8_9BACL|nr:sulfite exporter TauE/SafE family protein [Ureibacillus sp. BA0131]MDN4494440.1 sulfite exporter TauE/SafE family protein [Ureibacillus sp. BA0131]